MRWAKYLDNEESTHRRAQKNSMMAPAKKSAFKRGTDFLAFIQMCCNGKETGCDGACERFLPKGEISAWPRGGKTSKTAHQT